MRDEAMLFLEPRDIAQARVMTLDEQPAPVRHPHQHRCRELPRAVPRQPHRLARAVDPREHGRHLVVRDQRPVAFGLLAVHAELRRGDVARQGAVRLEGK